MDTVNKIRHAIGLNSGDNQFASPDVVSNRQGSLMERLNALQMILGHSAGKFWCLDASNGDDDNSGQNWDAPKLTMAAVFALLGSGDTVFFKGKIKENLVTPVQVFDVTIVGVGNRPRHIDGTPKAGSESTAMWTEPAASPVSPLCKVLQQGWRFINTLFAGPADASCVQVFSDLGVGDAERSGGHAEFINCRFASGLAGIESHGGTGYCGVYGCYFQALTGYALMDTVGAGGGVMANWDVVGNTFEHCANVMGDHNLFHWRIRENMFISCGPGVILNTDAEGAGASNVVTDNIFNVAVADWTEANGFVGAATDVWANNKLIAGPVNGVPADA